MSAGSELSGKIVAWNIKDGFDGPDALAIAEKIISQEPDVVFLSEASKQTGGKPAEVINLLREAVGPIAEVDYGDKDARRDTHSFIGIACKEYGIPVVRQMAGRRGLLYSAGGVSILGYHGLDRKYRGTRNDHEIQRVIQAEDALDVLAGAAPAIIAGDLNTMHGSDPNAQLLRAAGWLSDLLPAGEPGEPQSKIARVGSLAQRLSAMAFGDSLSVLENAGFVDADPHHAGTKAMVGNFLNVQLDHILTRGVTTTGFEVVPADGLSDHDMVTARFSMPR